MVKLFVNSSLGCLFLLPVGQMQVLFNLPTFVPMLHGFFWLIIRFSKRMLRIADGFSDDFECFYHGSCRYGVCIEDSLTFERSLLRPWMGCG